MRILVLGATGGLGRHIVEILRGKGEEVHATSLNGGANIAAVDARSEVALLEVAQNVAPAWIIHSIAQTDVDRCEQHPEEARKTNVDTVVSASHAAGRVGARLAFMSTNGVFDGARGMYTEDDPPSPMNEYGRTKLAAERAANDAPGALILRASMLTWTGRSKLPFIHHVVDQLQLGREVAGYDDIWDSPVHASTIADVFWRLMTIGAAGTFHVASERASRYQTARDVAETLGLPAELVQKISSGSRPQQAPRPVDTSLDATLLLTRFGIRTPAREQVARLATEATGHMQGQAHLRTAE
ncbi:MAG: SDR family oxidoreductase [Candidatus Dormibacteria bacterium]